MKVKAEQLEQLASTLLDQYRNKELILVKASDAAIKTKIAELINANFAEEEAIEEEARKMLAQHARAARDMDPYRMFLIAKQKIASKRGFIL